ncbi:putative Inositol polyphosphate kinase-like protein [Leptomonas pyrrhocoris]|uniref:Kinase n=1 Tax=Leptomonas pyrrhocoris TaxID=157538 RepID=A0A0N0DT98_LEPPY|nr:putative Inositol polyphosphate kinase-like protein [Leptomonas pyrrhocoris]KPA77188.1 putative Inositol polyphosphate kinase-like protein [Leptomonas pyrrhocoris]|eukprot:XP_015655627.1 putative Inositol polyphosphate kinase-like protein [Leptomonas pyrrhocoris]
MSSLVDNTKPAQWSTAVDAAATPASSPKKQLRTSTDSRGSNTRAPPPQPTDPTSAGVREAANPAAAAVCTTTMTANAMSPDNPQPRHDSSDDLDGYRSSCERSASGEGLHGSRELNSRGSSSSGGALESSDALLLSAHIWADASRAEHGVGAQAEARGFTISDSSSSVGGVGCSASATSPPHPPHYHHHHHDHAHAAPRSSAARDKERQRLIALSAVEEPTAAAAGASVTTAPNVTSNRSDGKSGRATAVITPVSLAEASAADSDSDCSSADALCHGTQPVFASTSVKTAAAMMSVLDSESRGEVEAAPGTDPVKAADDPTNGKEESNAVMGSGDTGALPRVIPHAADSKRSSPSPHTLSAAEAIKSPLQATFSRLSRSSSNDSGAVEASAEFAVPPPSTSAHRSGSISPTVLAVNEAYSHSTHHNKNYNNASNNSIGGRSQVAGHRMSLDTPVVAPLPITPEVSAMTAVMLRLPLAEAPVTAADAPAKPISTDESGSGVTAAAAAAPQLRSTSSSEMREKGESTTTATGASTATAAAMSTAEKGEVQVPEVTSLGVNTTTNTVIPPLSKSATTASSSFLTSTVDVSSSSSIGGHHLSVTEGNAFLKQSGSRREEAFYSMIRPYQETLVHEAVCQAPHTVEHWRRQNAASSHPGAHLGDDTEGNSSGGATATATATATGGGGGGETPAVIRCVHADMRRTDGPVAAPVSHRDEAVSECDARWKAYQRIEAEDLSSLDILASAPPTTEEEKQHCPILHRMRSGTGDEYVPPPPGCPAHPRSVNNDINSGNNGVVAVVAADAAPALLEPQVDENLVELAARLWWTIRFRHFYRTSSAAYEVQRQAAEAAGMSSPSSSASPVAGAGGKDGAGVSRCSTPAAQPHYPTSPTPGLHFKEEPIPSPILSLMPQSAARSQVVPLSGTATPNMVGSFAASSLEGTACAVSLTERQYNAQKHRALQLLAAFVPRYHGTCRLFLKDVLRCERRGIAAAAAAATTSAAAVAAASPSVAAVAVASATAATAAKDRQNPLAECQGDEEAAAAAPVPQIVDADDDGNEAGGSRKICRMIMLEYVCYKFARPCVMDIKMGSRQYGLHPTAEKKRSKEQKAKLSTSARYGIRLAGYRRWNTAESRYSFRSKLQCRTLTLHEVKNEISAFMLHNRELERVFQRQLQRLRVAFSQQTVFRFYTSSLLFVYDAEDPLATARVTMVDFAYTYESKELLQGGDPDADFAYDVGYLKAIDTLLSLLA